MLSLVTYLKQVKSFKLSETKPPLPPFPLLSAKTKVQAAEDTWNSRDPERVALACTENSQWRNRDEFFSGREQIKAFLTRKWAKELDYCLKKELWSFPENRSSKVRRF
ncbi:DUF1348 family protein [Microcoleus sp. herbarium7]|uniref:DUF1348 family protein n=1 Tax=unclassified Microcoleus TaxID=2642155 RepID=UPI002FD394B5